MNGVRSRSVGTTAQAASEFVRLPPRDWPANGLARNGDDRQTNGEPRPTLRSGMLRKIFATRAVRELYFPNPLRLGDRRAICDSGRETAGER
jgi:hypothetical protein